jgi:DNA recombination protein RmuC
MNILLYLAAGCSTLAAIFAFLALLAARWRRENTGQFADEVARLVRTESDRLRTEGAEQARGMRQELAENLRGFQTATLQAFTELGRQLDDQIREFGGKHEAGLRLIDERADGIGARLDEGLERMNAVLHRSLAEMAASGDVRHRGIVHVLDEKTTRLSETIAEAARALRIELTANVQHLGTSLSDTLTSIGAHQKERLEELTRALTTLTESQIKTHDSLRSAVENRLDAIRTENANKLDEMRQTVDEKLQTTFEQRLGESFRIVSEQLERVYQGLGEMQSLAAGVGDLKRVLSNVKVRGTWGEIQLGSLLEQFLAPDQYVRNAKVRDDSSEMVEFAIRLPGHDSDQEVLLPIDAKFPQEDFDRLTLAAERGDAAGVEKAAAALEQRIAGLARSVKEKYINPPRTTDIAILFLPTESLYAEILRRPGAFEQLQREYHVTLAGPTTLTAILNALQMGFRSLAIEKRTSEVWQVLGAIKSEFGKYGDVVKRLRRQLNTAVNTVDTLGARTRVMDRKLRRVEVLPEGAAQAILGVDVLNAMDQEDENGAAEEPDSE